MLSGGRSIGNDSSGHAEVLSRSYPAHSEACSMVAKPFLYFLQGHISILPGDRSTYKEQNPSRANVLSVAYKRQCHLSRILERSPFIPSTLALHIQLISECWCLFLFLSSAYIRCTITYQIASLLFCCYAHRLA